jgi:serine/threonine protein phosphatase 1
MDAAAAEILTMDGALTFAIGDVHGCFEKLQSLLSACDKVSPGRPARYILLGDYIDRGPDSRKVVDLLIERQASSGGSFICLRGNHEQMLIEAAAPDRSDRALMNWWGNGGEQTLESYGIDDPTSLPAVHINWLKSLPLTVVDPGRLFVHAGIRPGIELSHQSEADLMGIREPFLSSEVNHSLFVVHGHTATSTRLPDLRANRVNMDTAACFGGDLTASVFIDATPKPTLYLNSRNVSWA